MKRALRITFTMPRTGEWAAGGFRTVYQLSNQFASRGHEVTIVHPGRMVINPTMLDLMKNLTRYAAKQLTGNYKPDSWLKMNPAVSITCTPSLSERYIPDGDIVFATAWQTAEQVRSYGPRKGARFYFIQHLETWNGPEERVLATWRAPLRKIVPSRWLADIAQQMCEEVDYIPYGLDLEIFYQQSPSEIRASTQVMMLYHELEWKGCEEGFAALHLVHEQERELRVILFGTPQRPEFLPDWVEYHQSPTPDQLRMLYNRAAIFLAPSRTEGWGLTGCEALLCGAALVATDIDGHREFAFNEETALTCAARSPVEMSNAVLRLIRDGELRLRLARAGHNFVRQLTWERAADRFEKVMLAEYIQWKRTVAHA